MEKQTCVLRFGAHFARDVGVMRRSPGVDERPHHDVIRARELFVHASESRSSASGPVPVS